MNDKEKEDDDEGEDVAADDDAVGDVPYIANLCVKAAHQRKGLGRQLVAAAEKDLRGHCGVFVAVESSNSGARAMYLLLGFVPVVPPNGSPVRRKVYYHKAL